jgi:hypothetical protein
MKMAMAPVKTLPRESQLASWSQHHSTTPMTTPTSGKQEKTHSMLVSSHSTTGIGILEYMAKVSVSDLKKLMNFFLSTK